MAAGTLDLLGGLTRPSPEPPVPASQGPPSSQLTIFYSGTVNVYNNVPADKAHAIMLLLANGNERHSRAPDADVVASTVNAGASTSTGVAIASRPTVGASAVFKQPLAVSTPPPQSPCPTSLPEKPRQTVLGKRTQAELPFARKASLARFLEKRKDRVQVKQGPALQEAAGDESMKSKPSNDEITLKE